MRVLLLCDDYWHPGEVPVEGVKPLEEEGFEFDIITDASELRPDKLKDYPVVLLSKSGEMSATNKDSWKTAEVQQAFVDYVESGGGLVAVHNATVPGEITQVMDRLIGSRFTFHPNNCPVTVQPVKPHPVTKGVGMFKEIDEHYRLEILSEDVDIIMASYSPPQGEESKYEEEPYHNTPEWICPAGYVRTQGKGRICVLTPGHLLPVWQNEHFKRALKNALLWCGRQGG